MNWQNYFTPVWIGLAYTLWSVVSSYLGVNGGWAVLIVMSATVATLIINLVLESKFSVEAMPLLAPILILMALGVYNGQAMFVYGQKIVSREVPASVIMIGTAVMMIVWAGFLDWLLNGVTPTPRRAVAFVLAFSVIYLMNSDPRP